MDLCTHSNLHVIVYIELNIYPSIHQPMHPAMDHLPINLWSRLSIHSFIPFLLPFTHHTHLSTYTPIHLPTHQPTHPSPPTYPHTHLTTHTPIHLPIPLTLHPPTYSPNLTPIHLLTHPFTYPHIFTAFYATIIYWCHWPNHLLIPSIHARFKPTHPSVHAPIHPPTHPPIHLSVHRNTSYSLTNVRFPIANFKPLQDPPAVELAQAKELFEFLDRLLPGVSACFEIALQNSQYSSLANF